jgi:hypothetical protein
MSDEYGGEPIRGLPAELPAGESILWQGSPIFRKLAQRALHVRQVAWYFGLLAVWGIFTRVSSGASFASVTVAMAEFAGLAVVAVALLVLFAWLVAGSTVYTITNRRVVIRFGIAVQITLQIPFREITRAGVCRFSDGAGDISLALQSQPRIGYLILWPHTRPWRFYPVQPALRAIPEAEAVASLLARALAASAEQSAQPLALIQKETKNDGRLPAAA